VRVGIATEAGSPGVPSEDYATVGPETLVVLDGATVRTATGCGHGVAWYVAQLAAAILRDPEPATRAALGSAVGHVAGLHRHTCDLDHPGTPSAAVAILGVGHGMLRYLVLGDVTIVIEHHHRRTVVTDDRVGRTARAERAHADTLPHGSPEKAEALVRMKHAELAARNTPDGFWIAAADPAAAGYAITGAIPVAHVRRAAVLTDGAARIVTPFRRRDWTGVLDLLAAHGPERLIAEVRRAERADPHGLRWPRNKISDDATAAYCHSFQR
jgi:hypothetical protein